MTSLNGISHLYGMLLKKGGDILKIKAIDTLITHHTTIGQIYKVLSHDDDCYKIEDDRGKTNWLPKRYFEVVEE